jgi:hypothetical protein
MQRKAEDARKQQREERQMSPSSLYDYLFPAKSPASMCRELDFHQFTQVNRLIVVLGKQALDTGECA